MQHASEDAFAASAETHEFDTLLFDMDGTIIDSTPAIIKYWHQLGKEIGVDGDVVSHREGLVPKQYGSDAVEIEGSRALLDTITEAGIPWGIVTSGTRPLVTGWLDRMKLAIPETMVTAEDVAKGKPDPACYQLGAQRVAATFKQPLARPERTAVFEDAPAGIRAGKAAGYKVIALATTHSIDVVKAAGPDWIVKDMRSITLAKSTTGHASIKIEKALL
ncbi:hypothetical protein AMS68_007547 [Peltaster fructicola]|uniref:Uncharacterized protein n=1 Tax=Peltaster fructicola TaxID=286661 RepID=A0A6H0Y607_9PEZI|nr:hypothetical protein AMS68_007547 [Peltaster fructicola]